MKHIYENGIEVSITDEEYDEYLKTQSNGGGRLCGAMLPPFHIFMCTLDAGHKAPHIAHGEASVQAVWYENEKER